MNNQQQIRLGVDEIIGLGKVDMIDKYYSSDYKAHAGDKKYQGHQFLRRYANQVRKAIPDIKCTRLEFLSQSDKMITWQRSFSGTHMKNMKGIPASGKKVKWYEIVVTRFEDGKIAEEWISSDLGFQLMLKTNPEKAGYRSARRIQ